MKLEAEIKSIKKILADDENFFQVPDYQRPYSWDKDNIADLIDDLISAFNNNQEEDYFCGSLVLVNNTKDQRYDIIDGQQRITTFTIIACVLRDVYNDYLSNKAKKYIKISIQDEFDEDKRKLKFLTNDKYQIDFEETVLKKINFVDIKNIENSYPNNKYLQNAYFAKEILEEKVELHNIDIDEFVIWLYEKVVLTTIICPSQDTAIQIFNVLNDRGMPLSTIDILKSSLMSSLSNEDRKAFITKWENIIANLEISELDLESMLNTYLYYKLASNPKSRLDKELISIFKKEQKSSLEIIKEISDFSLAFIDMDNLQDKAIYCLKYLRHKIYWRSIITTAIFENYKDINGLKKLLLAYYYQNWVAGATVARIKQASFNVLKLVKNHSDINAIYEELKNSLDRHETTKNFKEALNSSQVYGKKWDRSILLLVEYFSSDESKLNFIPLESKLHLEHIIPQSPTDFWKAIFNDEDLNNLTNSLANLTLLSLRKNMQASNKDFAEKKLAYCNKDNVITSYLITQQILNEPKWDNDALKRREKYLLDIIYSHLLMVRLP